MWVGSYWWFCILFSISPKLTTQYTLFRMVHWAIYYGLHDFHKWVLRFHVLSFHRYFPPGHGLMSNNYTPDQQQLTFEQHSFELCRSTYMWIFFSINTCTVLDPWPRIHRCGGLTIYIVLYHLTQGTGASGFLYSQGVLERIPHGYQEQLKFGGSQKLYMSFWLCGVSAPLTPMLFKNQLFLSLNFNKALITTNHYYVECIGVQWDALRRWIKVSPGGGIA